MKYQYRIFILTLTISLGLADKCSGQWIQSFFQGGGGFGGFIDSGSKLFVGEGGGSLDGAVLVSEDHGLTWQVQADSFHSGVDLAIQGKILFASIGYSILRSSDDGKNWIPANHGLAPDSAIIFLAVSGTSIFAGSNTGGVYRSDDSGGNWSKVNKGLPSTFITGLAACAETLYAGTGTGLFQSTDKGSNWSKVTAVKCTWGGEDLVTSGQSIFLQTDSGLYLSTDAGKRWLLVYSGFFDASALAISGSNLFATVSQSQLGPAVYLSTDIGKNWTPIDMGDPDRVGSIVVSGPNVVLGSSVVGIWYAPLSDFGISATIHTSNVQSISLFPNPTSGPVTVRGVSAAVTVTNVLGECVAGTGIREPEPGDVELDLSRLPAGTYFARIETPGGVVVRKILKE